MARTRLWAGAVLVALLCGCSDRSTPGAAIADAGVTPTVSSEDTAVAGPSAAELQFTLTVNAGDAGLQNLVLSTDEKPEIEPTTELRLRSNLALSNYRIRVFDEVDRAMVSDDVGEDTAKGLDYRIVFQKSLKRGHRYTIVIDGQSGPLFSDASGKTHPERRYELRVAGEREKAKPAPKRRRRR